MILTVHKEIQDEEPDPVWDERLGAASSKFIERKDKAVSSMKGWTGRAAQSEPAPQQEEDAEDD